MKKETAKRSKWDLKISELLSEIGNVKDYLSDQERKLDEIGAVHTGPVKGKKMYKHEDAKIQLSLLEQAKATVKAKQDTQPAMNSGRKVKKFKPMKLSREERECHEINRGEIIKLKELIELEESDLSSAPEISQRIKIALRQSTEVIEEANDLLNRKVAHPPEYMKVMDKVLREKQVFVPGFSSQPLLRVPEPHPITLGLSLSDTSESIGIPFPMLTAENSISDSEELQQTLGDCQRAEQRIQHLLSSTLGYAITNNIKMSHSNISDLKRLKDLVSQQEKTLNDSLLFDEPKPIGSAPSDSDRDNKDRTVISSNNKRLSGLEVAADLKQLSSDIDDLLARTLEASQTMQEKAEVELQSPEATPVQIREEGGKISITLTLPSRVGPGSSTLELFSPFSKETSPDHTNHSASLSLKANASVPLDAADGPSAVSNRSNTSTSIQPSRNITTKPSLTASCPTPLQKSSSTRIAEDFTNNLFQSVLPTLVTATRNASDNNAEPNTAAQATLSNEAPELKPLECYPSDLDRVLEGDKDQDLLRDLDSVRRKMSLLERNIDSLPQEDEENPTETSLPAKRTFEMRRNPFEPFVNNLPNTSLPSIALLSLPKISNSTNSGVPSLQSPHRSPSPSPVAQEPMHQSSIIAPKPQPPPPTHREDKPSPRADLTRKFSKDHYSLQPIPEKGGMSSFHRSYQSNVDGASERKDFKRTPGKDPGIHGRIEKRQTENRPLKKAAIGRGRRQKSHSNQRFVGQEYLRDENVDKASVAVKETKASQIRKEHTKRMIEERRTRQFVEEEEYLRYCRDPEGDFSDISGDRSDGEWEGDNDSHSSRSLSSSSMSRLRSVHSNSSLLSSASYDEFSKRESMLETYRARRKLQEQQKLEEMREIMYAKKSVFR